MKTYNFELKNTNNIHQYIDFNDFKNHKNILIQIFCGQSNKQLQQITTQLKTKLPNATIIGTTTDGEIENKHIYTKNIVISISTFSHTTLNSASSTLKNSFTNGQQLAKKLIKKNTKLLIVFTDGTTTNGEEFLKGIQSIKKDIIVAGGMAGDNGNFIQTYISCDNLVLSSGAVGVSLNSDHLKVYNDYSFNWSPIGVGHRIDKVKNNRVYLIDGITPVEFYAKYLGKQVATLLPATGIEFPLIIEKNSIQIARAVISKHNDGSLSFAGNLNKGDIVRLGFGNAQMILSDQTNTLEKFSNTNIQSFFLYSCMARRRYMPNMIQIEIEPFAKIAPVAGFFTYGEFYNHNGINELLNQTLTVVALSETTNNISTTTPILDTPQKKDKAYTTTIQALTNLIQQSTADLEEQAKKLEEEKQFSQELLTKQRLFIRHAIHETITPLSVVMNNIELYEMEHNKNIYLSNIEASMKNIFTIFDDLSYFVKKNQLKYPKHNIDIVSYIKSRIEFFTQVAIQTNLSFHFITNIPKIIIFFNETKLQRIIDNNITNALKYTKEGEQINITIKAQEQKCKISICSKSTHIQQPNKVFEAYYREAKSKEGFGLGLNLVKQICDEENIKIKLKSNINKTCFKYSFNIKGDK